MPITNQLDQRDADETGGNHEPPAEQPRPGADFDGRQRFRGKENERHDDHGDGKR